MASTAAPPSTDLHEWGNREQNTLVLNYTAACPLQCDFCCYGCGPKRREKMDFGFAQRLVLQSGKYQDFTAVGFTGGEPLMFVEEVTELAGIAKFVGKSTTIATSGHWATDRTTTSLILERLVANGLSRLNVSFDPSHAKFVPLQNVANIAETIPSFGIPLYIVSTYYDKALFDEVDLNAPEKGVFHFKKLVAKVGRATKKDVTYAGTRTLETFTCYRRYYHDLVVFYDGKAYPCCSTFNRASPGICLGNVFELGFEEIRSRLMGSLLFKTIKRVNFAQFVSVIARYDEECAAAIEQLPITGGACAFCNSIFRKPDLYGRVHRAFEKYEEDKLQSLLLNHNQLLEGITVTVH